MVSDDIAERRATPYECRNQIIIQQEDEKCIQLVEALKDICLKYQWKFTKDKSIPIIISSGDVSFNNLIKGFLYVKTKA
jgi:hypothetical protein